MPFRFNHKDLSVLAVQPSELFDKEGILWFKEKEGKLLNKRENFSERLCKLKGNLLFYFKGKDKTTECSGVIILERFKVVQDTSSNKHGFILDFDEPEEQKYEFAASSKEDYNEWIEKINAASYENLQKKLQDLRNQIVSITGQDPYPDYHPLIQTASTTNGSGKSNSRPVSLFSPTFPDLTYKDVMMEMCIACSGLQTETDSTPCAMVKVYTVSPPSTEWMKHSQTEVSEESYDPNFLRTIVFANEFDEYTRLKFVVYDVLSKAKSDTVTLGQAVCTIHEIQQAPNWSMEETSGTLTIQGWRRESTESFKERSLSSTPFDINERRNNAGKVEMTRTFTANVVNRSFHFPTKDGRDIKFQEILAETLLCFRIPKLLLNLFISEEKDGVVELHSIGQLHPEWERMKQVVQNYHFDLVHQYSTNLADLCQFEDMNFKCSVDKTKKELEFIPTNLHLQRLCVNETDKDCIYDLVTVGAPTAHSMKYKHGGLKRLLALTEENTRKQLQGFGKEERRKTGCIKAAHVKDVVKRISTELTTFMDEVKNVVVEKDYEKLSNTASLLSSKVGEILGLYATSFVVESAERMLKARTTSPELRTKQGQIIYSDLEDSKFENAFWEWTGSEFKVSQKQQTVTDCGVQEALGELMSSINYTCKTETLENTEELLAHHETLDKCLQSFYKKINVTMRFVLMEDEADTSILKELRYRRDVVFSQALTPVVSGFAIMLSQRLYDHAFMEQIANIGLLVHYESLLTTHGDEMGMLEDMYVGVQSLKDVTFKIVSSESDDLPTVTGKRSSIIVEFPIKSKQFLQLPQKLQERQIIRLHPVMFSIGINEQATLAEKFGDTSLQESINAENLASLQVYFDAFTNFAPDYVGSRSSDATTLTKLMEQLKSVVNLKKNKNYDILLHSEELCYRINGLRLTCCKSAKDRSSMSVTLEMIRTLQREHNMDEQVARRVLSTVRSQGTRLINSYKNVGLPKYAFNKVQVKALPSVYRPPEGTIGKYLQT